MNWKKILTFAFSGATAATLGHYTSEISQGHHLAFTAGNILFPGLGGLLGALAGLFTRRPQD